MMLNKDLLYNNIIQHSYNSNMRVTDSSVSPSKQGAGVLIRTLTKQSDEEESKECPQFGDQCLVSDQARTSDANHSMMVVTHESSQSLSLILSQ
jgi:hypothetical protein